LVCQEAHGYPHHNDDKIIRKQFRDKPWASKLEQELKDIPPLGMKDIKWITLYDDWRPMIPLDHRKDYRFFHEDPGPERREKSKLNRGEAAANRKNRTVTHDNDRKPAARKRKTQPTTAKPKPAKAAKADKKPRGPFIL
jgi:hypothetical protein